MVTEARYGHRHRPCTFATQDLLPDSRLHGSLAYCALNGRTLPSTRINAVSAPLMLAELKDSATFPKREDKKRDCARISTLRYASSAPLPCLRSPLCFLLLFIPWFPPQQEENLNFSFVLNFLPLFLRFYVLFLPLFIFFSFLCCLVFTRMHGQTQRTYRSRGSSLSFSNAEWHVAGTNV